MEGGLMIEQPIKQLLTSEHFVPLQKSDLTTTISVVQNERCYTDISTQLHDSKWIVSGYARKQDIHTHHDGPMAGHIGHNKTFELIDQNHWWPKMTEDIPIT